MYDPATNTWSSAGNMAHPAGFYGMAALGNGDVLVTGGGGSDAAVVERYDATGGTWTTEAPLLFAHMQHMALSLSDGSVMVLGGRGATDRPPHGTGSPSVTATASPRSPSR